MAAGRREPGDVRAGPRGPQGEVGREGRRHPPVSPAVQDRDRAAPQVAHRLAGRGPGCERAHGRHLRVAAGPQRRPAAHRMADQDDGHVGTVLVPDPVERPADVGVGVGGRAVPPGHAVAQQLGGDAPVAGGPPDEPLELAHPDQGQGAAARGLQAGGRPAVAEDGDAAEAALRGMDLDDRVGHARSSFSRSPIPGVSLVFGRRR